MHNCIPTNIHHRLSTLRSCGGALHRNKYSARAPVILQDLWLAIWSLLQTEKLGLQVSDDTMEGGYTAAQFHPDGLILGAGTQDSLVRIWEVRQQKVSNLPSRHLQRTAFWLSPLQYQVSCQQTTVVIKVVVRRV